MTDEEVLQKVEGALRHAHGPMGQTITTAIAVLGLIISVVYSWAVTEQRVATTETAVSAVALKAEQVPELRWEIAQIKRDLDRIDVRGRTMETKLDEIHEAMIRMGVVVGKREK